MLHSRLKHIAATLDEELDVAIRNTAEAIASGAQSRVPVDTGALRDSIHVDKVGDGSYAVIAGSSKVFYGHLVEHGTVKTPAHPFLIPAAEAERDSVDELARAAFRDL